MTTVDKQPEKTARLRFISRLLIVVSAVALALYDTLPALNPGRGDTISEGMRDWSRSAWVIPFLWGAITGHFFVNLGQPEAYRTLFFTFAALAVVAIVANVVTHVGFGWVAPSGARMGLLAAGMLAGVALWSQNA